MDTRESKKTYSPFGQATSDADRPGLKALAVLAAHAKPDSAVFPMVLTTYLHYSISYIFHQGREIVYLPTYNFLHSVLIPLGTRMNTQDRKRDAVDVAGISLWHT